MSGHASAIANGEGCAADTEDRLEADVEADEEELLLATLLVELRFPKGIMLD